MAQAGAADLAALCRGLGSAPVAPEGPADVALAFADSLPAVGTLRFLAPGLGFDDGGLVLTDAEGARTARVALGGPEIVCLRGAAPASTLVALLDLAALRRGLLPLHASAVTLRGRVVAAAGPPNSGKTTALLGLLAGGGRFLADDRLYAGVDPPAAAGLGGRLEVRARHRAALADLAVPVRRSEWARLRLNLVAGRARRRAPGRAARRLLQAVEERSTLALAAGRVPGPPAESAAAGLRTLFLLVRHERAETRVDRLDVPAAAARLASLTEEDLAPLRRLLAAARFSSEQATDAPVETKLIDEAHVRRVLASVEVFVVHHHDRATPRDLASSMLPHCG